MRRKTSFKIVSESIEAIQEFRYTDLYEILNTSVNYETTLNEQDLTKLNELISFARDNGWYPTISKYLNDNIEENMTFYEKIYHIQKDELIWEYQMLLKESFVLKEFGMEEDVYQKFITELLSIKV